ncbi:hypothetical protein [Afifella aestuarii]|uniref:hypothetical protein n=1 Tax=Afifella aestuarii TaxID=1909496 RepID=UPI000FE2EDC5|nr:hypothetical protein [Afifella aestuarii]
MIRRALGLAATNPEAAAGVGAGAATGALAGGVGFIGISRADAIVEDAERAQVGLPPRTRTLFLRRPLELELRLDRPAEPVGRTDNNVSVRGAKSECDELCELACQCKRDRQGERTLTDCVSKKLRQKYYDKEGRKFADGTPRRPTSPTADGPRPEVSYRKGSDGTYQPVESGTDAGMPSSQVPITGAPRPDVSWWKNGQLWKILELKFKGDKDTPMQERGAYRDIARDQGLDPDEDVIKLDVEKDCVEGSDGRCKAKPDKC